ncbi:hypothetical protein DOY81_015421 [Sarcophaga bullata]|nr:hypothetical protein DOY81_015421 [Sarcophaga bullata]
MNYIIFKLICSKLTKDMEMTKAQLENERKIQQLQMQAINALWKKVSSMQNASTSTGVSIDGQNIDNSTTTISSGGTISQQIQNTLSLDNSSTTVVTDLAKTCTMLTNQVQQLQGSMRDILNCILQFTTRKRETSFDGSG